MFTGVTKVTKLIGDPGEIPGKQNGGVLEGENPNTATNCQICYRTVVINGKTTCFEHD